MPITSYTAEEIDKALAALTERVDNIDRPIAGGLVAAGPNGTDDTATIAEASARGLVLQPGRYRVQPQALGLAPRIVGSGIDLTTIECLGAGITAGTGLWQSSHLSDLTVAGGVNPWWHDYAGTNVSGIHVVERVRFKGYTGTAVRSDSRDMPYWRVRDCQFWGANSTSTVGVGLAGGTDLCLIEGCCFLLNRIGVKLGRGGQNAKITGCDFIQFREAEPGVERSAIWCTPAPAPLVNAGQGLVVRDSKFGNENLSPTDLRILYAPQDGDDYANPSAATLDDGWFIAGHLITGCAFFGRTPGGVLCSPPVVTSRVGRVNGVRVVGNHFAASRPIVLVEFTGPMHRDSRVWIADRTVDLEWRPTPEIIDLRERAV